MLSPDSSMRQLTALSRLEKLIGFPTDLRIISNLVQTSGIPSFFAVPCNKRIKSAENFSEKNRKEPIKWTQAYGVWEKVEYRLDE